MWGPAGAFGAALSFLGTLSFPRRHRQSIEVIGQIHNRHKYQPNRDELKELDLQNVTRRDAKEVDRLYNQLESTGGEPQSGDELNEGGFDKEIQEENRRLDRIDNICRGC